MNFARSLLLLIVIEYEKCEVNFYFSKIALLVGNQQHEKEKKEAPTFILVLKKQEEGTKRFPAFEKETMRTRKNFFCCDFLFSCIRLPFKRSLVSSSKILLPSKTLKICGLLFLIKLRITSFS